MDYENIQKLWKYHSHRFAKVNDPEKRQIH